MIGIQSFSGGLAGLHDGKRGKVSVGKRMQWRAKCEEKAG